MAPRLSRRSRTVSPLLGVLLTGAVLAGCHPAGPHERPAPSTPAPPPASVPTVGSGASVSGCVEAISQDHSVEGRGSRRFEITREQLAVITSHLIEVLCGQGLWKQDVGFGFNYEKDPDRVFVLISPGRSGLTAKQILDRLLGRA